jgi:hypothetical protein
MIATLFAVATLDSKSTYPYNAVPEKNALGESCLRIFSLVN